jgi:formylglycine-generating enzyme
VVLAALALLGACQVVGDYQTFERSEPPPPSPRARPCDAIQDQIKQDDPAPALILIHDPDATCFWMDETEVTVGQYRVWLDELDQGMTSPAWNREFCGWKSVDEKPVRPDGAAATCPVPYAPPGTKPFADEQPVRCVDWCEAAAYCKWAGKRLCKVGATDEWAIACSNGYAQEYPYDRSAPQLPCNYGQTCPGCGPFPADQDQRCRPAPGSPLNLGGNVEEWVDACDAGHGQESAYCGARGGSYISKEPQLQCSDVTGGDLIFRRNAWLGFRCCQDLTFEEEKLVRAR